MIRLFSEGVLLFLLPFVAYAALLMLRQQVPFLRDAWTSQRFLHLAMLGLICAVLGLVGLGFAGQRHTGAYQPAHLDHGRLVPGRME